MTKALADRLAEAYAEYLHERVRKDYWGYDKDESLKSVDLHKLKYQVFIQEYVFIFFFIIKKFNSIQRD